MLKNLSCDSIGDLDLVIPTPEPEVSPHRCNGRACPYGTEIVMQHTTQLWANIQKQVDAREAAGEIDNENKEAFLSRYISLGTLITEV